MEHQELPQAIRDIQTRNARVELEKAWETSWTRRLSIAALTYLVASAFLWQVGVPLPFLQGLVPAGGYVLSTLSLPWIKHQWMTRR